MNYPQKDSFKSISQQNSLINEKIIQQPKYQQKNKLIKQFISKPDKLNKCLQINKEKSSEQQPLNKQLNNLPIIQQKNTFNQKSQINYISTYFSKKHSKIINQQNQNKINQDNINQNYAINPIYFYEEDSYNCQEVNNINSSIHSNQQQIQLLKQQQKLFSSKSQQQFFNISQNSELIKEKSTKLYYQKYFLPQQNLKYIAFIIHHQTDFTNKRKALYRQCCQYVTNGDYQKFIKRHSQKLRNLKNMTYREYVQKLIQQSSFTQQQVKQEIQRLKSYESQNLSMNINEQTGIFNFKQIIQDIPPQDLSPQNIKLLFDQLTPYVNLSNIKFRVVPCANINNTSRQKTSTPFLAIISLSMDLNIQKAYKIVKHWSEQKQQNVEFSKQSIDEQLMKIDSSQILEQDLQNKIMELDIVQHIYDINSLSNIQDLDGFDSQNKNCSRKEWKYQENFKFFLFCVLYIQSFMKTKEFKLKFFKIMSNFIKTKSPVKCYQHFKFLSQPYDNLQSFLQGEIKKYSIDRDKLAKEVQKHIKRCKNGRKIVFCGKGTKWYRTRKQLDLNNLDNVRRYLRNTSLFKQFKIELIEQ